MASSSSCLNAGAVPRSVGHRRSVNATDFSSRGACSCGSHGQFEGACTVRGGPPSRASCRSSRGWSVSVGRPRDADAGVPRFARATTPRAAGQCRLSPRRLTGERAPLGIPGAAERPFPRGSLPADTRPPLLLTSRLIVDTVRSRRSATARYDCRNSPGEISSRSPVYATLNQRCC
jgi:hypothetical protein